MMLKSKLPLIYMAYCVILIIVMLVFNARGITYFGLIAGSNDQAQKSANHFHK